MEKPQKGSKGVTFHVTLETLCLSAKKCLICLINLKKGR